MFKKTKGLRYKQSSTILLLLLVVVGVEMMDSPLEKSEKENQMYVEL